MPAAIQPNEMGNRSEAIQTDITESGDLQSMVKGR